MTEHYFSERQTSEFRLDKFSVTLRGIDFEFFTARGIFSWKKVDFGTKVLVENMRIGSSDSVLDLGCGIGVVGVVASRMTSGKVVLVDVNKRAVKIARMNVKGLNAEVRQGNMYNPVRDEKFDVILLNPPQAAGKDVCFGMIEGAREHLNKKGSLQIVARHNKGGKVLSEKMKGVFGNVDTLVKKGGYRVYISVF